MSIWRAVVSFVVGSALALGVLMYAWSVNQHAAVLLVPAAWVIEAVNRLTRLPVWLNQLLLLLITGFILGSIMLYLWARLLPRRSRGHAA